MYVDKSVLFVNEETEDIQVNSFSLLDGMALQRPQAGAFLISAHACPVVHEGESLVNSSIIRREMHCKTVRDARSMMEHADKCSPPHIFSEGDLVYYGNDPEPSLVVRIGYDSYINEVRVRRLNEPTTFSAGQWVNHARLHVLEIGIKCKWPLLMAS